MPQGTIQIGLGARLDNIDRAKLHNLLQTLEPRIQKRALRPALQDSAKRIKAYIVQNLSGSPVGVRTGKTRRAYRKAKIRAERVGRSGVAYSIKSPTRDELGIDARSESYYPYALEYGTSRIPAKRFIRGAVDDHRDQEIREIASKVRSVLSSMRV